MASTPQTSALELTLFHMYFSLFWWCNRFSWGDAERMDGQSTMFYRRCTTWRRPHHQCNRRVFQEDHHHLAGPTLIYIRFKLRCLMARAATLGEALLRIHVIRNGDCIGVVHMTPDFFFQELMHVFSSGWGIPNHCTCAFTIRRVSGCICFTNNFD